MEFMQFETDLRDLFGDGDVGVSLIPELDCFPCGYAPRNICSAEPQAVLGPAEPQFTGPPSLQYEAAPSPAAREKRRYSDLDPPPPPNEDTHSKARLASIIMSGMADTDNAAQHHTRTLAPSRTIAMTVAPQVYYFAYLSFVNTREGHTHAQREYKHKERHGERARNTQTRTNAQTHAHTCCGVCVCSDMCLCQCSLDSLPKTRCSDMCLC
jgi:hypothetical protein